MQLAEPTEEEKIRDLHRMFQDRHEVIYGIFQGWQPVRPQNATPRTIGTLFGLAMDRLFGAPFGYERGRYTSWVPQIALTVLLTAKRRMTVDIVAAYLDFPEVYYGLRPRSIIEFAKGGALLLNIRDYDPRASAEPGSKNHGELRKLSRHYEFLKLLFDQVPHATYFLATVRDFCFDGIEAGRSGRLRELQGELAKELDPAFKAIDTFNSNSRLQYNATFRGQMLQKEAVAWHWAYLQAARSVVNRAHPELLSQLDEQYREVLRGGNVADVATRALRLARTLRYAHLLFTAPLTASFGGTYNVLLKDEVPQLREIELSSYGTRGLGDFEPISDRFVRMVHYLQVGVLLPEYRQFIPERQWNVLKALGVTSNFRQVETSHAEHYADDANVSELLKYFHYDDGDTIQLQKIEADLLELPEDGGAETFASLAKIATMASTVRANRAAQLSEFTEAYQSVSTASQDLIGRHHTVTNQTDARAAYAIYRHAEARSKAEQTAQVILGSKRDAPRAFYHLFSADPTSRG